MKKLLTICTLGIVLTSCGTKTIIVEKVVDTTLPKVTQTAPDSSSSEENFLNGLTNDYPSEVASLGKTKVLELGRLTCGSINEGSTLSDFVGMANQTGVDAGFIGSLIREAVENFCPENQWFIDSALNGI